MSVTPPEQSTPEPAAPVTEALPVPEPVPTRSNPLSVYEDVKCEVRLDQAANRWVLGCWLDGVFVPFADRRMGGVLDDIQEHLTPGFKEKRAAAEDARRGVNRVATTNVE